MASEVEKQAIYEAMDACRPGRQDLADPGLAFLAQALVKEPGLGGRYRWSQAFDRQVAAAFADLQVPEGVEGRILEKLRAALAAQGGSEHVGVTSLEEGGLAGQTGLEAGFSVQEPFQAGEDGYSEQGVGEGLGILRSGVGETEKAEFRQNKQYTQHTHSREYTETSPAQATPLSRKSKLRRWFLLAGVGTAAVAGLVWLFWPRESAPPLSVAQIQQEALRFAMSEPQELFGSGQPWIGQPGVGPLAFSRAIWVPGRPWSPAEIRFRKVSGLLGREGLAYDLRSAEGLRATLYVVPIHQAGGIPVEANLPVEPPRYEQTLRTGGYCAAAWQENGLLYLLVVHGDSARAYYHFFRPQVVT